jgi:hypothetical protein
MLIGSRVMGLGSCVAEGCTSVTDMGNNIGDCSNLLGQAFNPKCWFGPSPSPSPITIAKEIPENYADQGNSIITDANLTTPLIDLSGFSIPILGISGDKVFLGIVLTLGLVLFMRRG